MKGGTQQTSIGKNGAPVIDPTANVMSLVEASVQRQDDLRAAESRRVDEQANLRAEHAKELSIAESKRIDAIRAVDVNAVAVASERATAQAAVLATQVTASADALRALVSTTATTMATAAEKFSAQLTERLALLERAQYESKGRSGVSDPMMAELVAEVKKLSAAGVAGPAKSAGAQAMWGYIVGGLGFVAMLLGIAIALVKFGAGT